MDVAIIQVSSVTQWFTLTAKKIHQAYETPNSYFEDQWLHCSHTHRRFYKCWTNISGMRQ